MDEEKGPEDRQPWFRSGLILFDTTGGGLLFKSFEISGMRVREPCGVTNTSPRCEVPMLVLVRIGVRIAGADVFSE